MTTIFDDDDAFDWSEVQYSRKQKYAFWANARVTRMGDLSLVKQLFEARGNNFLALNVDYFSRESTG